MSESKVREKQTNDVVNAKAHPTRSCATCTSCVAGVGSIECHAHPPTGVPVLRPDARGNPVVAATIAVFPPVNDKMWCGEWSDRGDEVRPLPVPRVVAPERPALLA